jgi:hypothetical protein
VGLASADIVEWRRGWEEWPRSARPACYWYWLNGVVTKDGITRDLEALAARGVGGAYIGHIGFNNRADPNADTPQNATTVPLSDEWYDLLAHAVREGRRLGVEIGVFNGPGWSQSGGPWVTPGDSMQFIDYAELRVSGPGAVEVRLPRAQNAVRDVRVVAFRRPPSDEPIRPAGASSNLGLDLAPLIEGRPLELPEGHRYEPLTLTFAIDPEATVRSLVLRHRNGERTTGRVLASDDGATFRLVREFVFDRRSGPLVTLRSRPSDVALPPTRARFIRLEIGWDTRPDQQGRSIGVELSGAARLDAGVERQLGVASRDITPPWDAYRWPAPPEPDAEAAVIRAADVVDLTNQLDADGVLRWTPPDDGEWVVQRFFSVGTGARNGPAPSALTGLEIDKMSRAAVNRHLDRGIVGELLRRLPDEDRTGLRYLIADSYEKGLQNWSADLESIFAARYGYDPARYLPVLSGRVVGSASESARFLWDLRRLIADRIATEYVGGMRAWANERGLRLWLENYGHFGFPSEFLLYGGESDAIGGEYWSNKPLGQMETRAAASAAHIYGKPTCSAESFTAAGSLRESPFDLKARGDLAFASGVNHYVLHVVAHQPSNVAGPGLALLWGTYFDRNAPWFAEHGKAWVDYVSRTSYLLQQGRPGADVAYYIGEDVPQMTGTQVPPLPPGYLFDWINASVLKDRATVRAGRLELSGGASYAVLVVPPLEEMRPEVLDRLLALAREGLTIVVAGPKPTGSPSLEGFPNADARVKALADELWPVAPEKRRVVGAGAVWRTDDLSEVFAAIELEPALIVSNPAVAWIQRRSDDAELFYIANLTLAPLELAPSFRASAGQPERWDAQSGQIERLAAYRVEGQRTVVPLVLAPLQSAFIVFPKAEGATPGIVDVRRDGASVLMWSEPKRETPDYEVESRLGMSVWAKPDRVIRLPEIGKPAGSLADGAWVFAPTRGDKGDGPGSGSLGDDHAHVGLSIGRNGVTVVQRSASETRVVLTWAAPEPLADWTHVALVHHAGEPALRINGIEVARGVKGEMRLVAGDLTTVAGTIHDGGLPRVTRVRDARTSYAGWTDDELARQSRTLPSAEPAVQVRVNAAGRAVLVAREAGAYEVVRSDGVRTDVQLDVPRPAMKLEAPWQVSFTGAAAPTARTFETLSSWSESHDPALKYFSGTGHYTTTFELPADFDPQRSPSTLDLGDIAGVARVTVNGTVVATTIRGETTFDLASTVRAGLNELRVDVTTNWVNRMVGDERFPDDLADHRARNGNLVRWPDWALNGTPRPEPRRVTLSSRRFVTRETPLEPSGLLGPVTIRFATAAEVK